MSNLPEQINAKLKGTAELENGNVTNPSLCFINSQDTGFYYTPNHINVSIDGINVYTFGSTGPIFDSALFLQEVPIPSISGTEGALYKKIGDDGLYWKTQSGIINLTSGGMSFPLLAPTSSTPQYSFVDNDTTGISYFGTNLYFSNNGQSSIIIDSVHNVGIGSFTDPTNKLYIDGNTKINGDLLILNNLYVNGTTYLIDTQNITVINSYIELASNNISDTLNIGIFGQYVASGIKYSGIFRKASDGEWYIWKDYTDDPTINWVGATLANLNVNQIKGNLSGQVLTTAQNSISSIPNLTTIGELIELKMGGNINLQNNDINSVDTINTSHIISTDLSGTILTSSQTNINQIANTLEQSLEIAPLSDDIPYSFKVDGIIECLTLSEYNSGIFDQEFLLPDQIINANLNGIVIDNFINYVDQASSQINGSYTGIKHQLTIDNTNYINNSPINEIYGIHDLGVHFNDNLNAKNILNIYGIKVDNNPICVNGTITNLYGIYIGNPTSLFNINNPYGLYSDAMLNYIRGLKLGNGGIDMNNYNITNVGTVDGEWSGDIINPAKGGTGINNNSTITIGGNIEFKDNYTFTANLTDNTNITFPTSGTLLASSGGGYVSSITGTSNQIYASNSTGNITLSTPQDIATTSSPTFNQVNATTLAGTIITSTQTNITEIGIINTGTWEADIIGTIYGGTGNSSYLPGEILIGNNSNGLTKNTLTGTPDQINISNGNGTIIISTPQNIATTSSPTFNQVNATTLAGTIITSSQTNITEIGTINIGTWQANVIGTIYGGTSYSSYLPGEILLGDFLGGLSKYILTGVPNQININIVGSNLELSTPQDIGLYSSVHFGSLNINDIINLNSNGTITGILGITMSGTLNMNYYDIDNVVDITAYNIYGTIMTGNQTNIYQIGQVLVQSLEINSGDIIPKIDGRTIFKISGVINTINDGTNYTASQNIVEFRIPNNSVNSTAIGSQSYGVLNYNNQTSSRLTGGYVGMLTRCDVNGTANNTTNPFYNYIGFLEQGLFLYSDLNGQTIDSVFGISVGNNPFPNNGAINTIYGIYIGNPSSPNIYNKWGLYSDAERNYMSGLKIGVNDINMQNNDIINCNDVNAIQFLTSNTSSALYPTYEFSSAGYGFYYDGTYLGISTNSISRMLFNSNGGINIGNSNNISTQDIISINAVSTSSNIQRIDNIYLNSSFNNSYDSGNLISSINISDNFNPSIITALSILTGLYINPIFIPSVLLGTPTISIISSEYIQFTSTIPFSMSVTNSAGLYINSPNITKNGTLTNNYGIYVASPGTAGTNNYGIYVNDNGVFNNSNNKQDLLTLSGITANNNTTRVSTLYLNSTINGALTNATLLSGLVNTNTISPSITTGATDLAGNYINTIFSPTVATGTPTITRISSEYIKFTSTIPTNMTVTNLSALYIDSPVITKNGTLTNNYGIYIASPGTAGTNNYGIYTDATNNYLNNLKIGGGGLYVDNIYEKTTSSGISFNNNCLFTNKNLSNINSLTATTLTGTIQTASQTNINQIASTLLQSLTITPPTFNYTSAPFLVNGIISATTANGIYNGTQLTQTIRLPPFSAGTNTLSQYCGLDINTILDLNSALTHVGTYIGLRLTNRYINVGGVPSGVVFSNVYGIIINNPLAALGSGKTVTNCYNLYVSAPDIGGSGSSVTNSYQIYLPAGVANGYGIYSLTRSYFSSIITPYINNTEVSDVNTNVNNPFISINYKVSIYSDIAGGVYLGFGIGPSVSTRVLRMYFNSTGILSIGATQIMTDQYSCVINPYINSTNTTRVCPLYINATINTSTITAGNTVSNLVNTSTTSPVIATSLTYLTGIHNTPLFSPTIATGTPTISFNTGIYNKNTITIPVNMTFTNSAGLYIDTPAITKNGTLTNNYGIYVASPGSAGTNNYAIYANATSYFNAIQFPTPGGGGVSTISNYETGTITITPSGAWTTPNLTVKFTAVGNNITLTFPNDVSNRTVTASVLTYTNAIPTRLLPPNDIYAVIYGQENTNKNFLYSINSSTGTITVAALPDNITHPFTSGNKTAGFYGWTVSYSL
jgi:hypothetical protein